ncbi:MAG: LuxR C-terminal-related transcriptional regulator [Terriglobales bacterium]|jgi:DNA-binding NarL/FixJ family response regulator
MGRTFGPYALGHDQNVMTQPNAQPSSKPISKPGSKSGSKPNPNPNPNPSSKPSPMRSSVQKPSHPAASATAPARVVKVLVADSGPIQSQLLTRALKSRRDFEVSAVALETSAVHKLMQSDPVDVVLLAGNHLPDLGLLRWLRVSYPRVAPVLLAENDSRELVVNAFRAGAKGIFLFAETPFPMLCKCIHCVALGEVWINRQQTTFLLDALSAVPTLRVVNSNGRFLLTPREEQVVALVADGLTNRGVALELGLSEHTIKKYLLRIFDKVGISSRVELVLYAMSHSEHRPSEWMPSTA